MVCLLRQFGFKHFLFSFFLLWFATFLQIKNVWTWQIFCNWLEIRNINCICFEPMRNKFAPHYKRFENQFLTYLQFFCIWIVKMNFNFKYFGQIYKSIVFELLKYWSIFDLLKYKNIANLYQLGDDKHKSYTNKL